MPHVPASTPQCLETTLTLGAAAVVLYSNAKWSHLGAISFNVTYNEEKSAPLMNHGVLFDGGGTWIHHGPTVIETNFTRGYYDEGGRNPCLTHFSGASALTGFIATACRKVLFSMVLVGYGPMTAM